MSSSGPDSTRLGNHRLTLGKLSARAVSPITWKDLVQTWQDYLEEKSMQNLVFVGDGEANRDEIMITPTATGSDKNIPRYNTPRFNHLSGAPWRNTMIHIWSF